MLRKYNGAQRCVALCLYLPCGCHSLHLCGVDTASSYTATVIDFGVIQTAYMQVIRQKPVVQYNSISLGPVEGFVCVSFTRDNLNCFRVK